MDHSGHAGHDMGAMSPSPTASPSATASPAGHDMSGMHMMMSMGTFHWGTSGDGIWIDNWVPQSEGAYIGACFGLFFFSVLSRGLPALEAYFTTWKRLRDSKISGNQLSAINPAAMVTSDIEKSARKEDSSSQSFHGAAYPNPLALPAVPPFSWSTDTIRSFLTAFTSFISYLLMMVVMTGNGGFFFVIIGGVFFGEMAFGRFRSLGGGFPDDHAH